MKRARSETQQKSEEIAVLKQKNAEIEHKVRRPLPAAFVLTPPVQLEEALSLLKSTHEALQSKEAALAEATTRNDDLYRSLQAEHGSCSVLLLRCCSSPPHCCVAQPRSASSRTSRWPTTRRSSGCRRRISNCSIARPRFVPVPFHRMAHAVRFARVHTGEERARGADGGGAAATGGLQARRSREDQVQASLQGGSSPRLIGSWLGRCAHVVLARCRSWRRSCALKWTASSTSASR